MDHTAKNEILIDIEAFVEEQLPLLRSVNDCWQPSDFLPDMIHENWHQKVDDLRKKSAGLSDEALVVLVGNVITEEALPSYQTSLSRIHGLSDETGSSFNPWALWIRRWTAEENRHGELLNKYLYLSGRVNVRSVEISTQHLIRNGFDSRSDNDPYRSIVYVSFQERATKISHANTAVLAEKCGDQTLSKICSVIAGDEARHEEAYKRIFRRILDADPQNAVIAFSEMMKRKIAMPALLMSEGSSGDLFNQFAVVAQRAGIYTIRDYAEVIKHLVDIWGIASIPGLSGEAAEAQDHLCALPDQYFAKVDRIREALLNFPKTPFEWIFNRNV